MTVFILLLFLTPLAFNVSAAETCGRTAIINNREVLLDTSSLQKGEGLRSWLERDKKALKHFNLYRRGGRIHWSSTLLGTLGPTSLIAGLLTNSDKKRKKTFFTWGAVLVLANFLISGTRTTANESHLEEAIDQYNKRHTPKIHFEPNHRQKKDFPFKKKVSLFLKKDWNF